MRAILQILFSNSRVLLSNAAASSGRATDGENTSQLYTASQTTAERVAMAISSLSIFLSLFSFSPPFFPFS